MGPIKKNRVTSRLDGARRGEAGTGGRVARRALGAQVLEGRPTARDPVDDVTGVRCRPSARHAGRREALGTVPVACQHNGPDSFMLGAVAHSSPRSILNIGRSGENRRYMARHGVRALFWCEGAGPCRIASYAAAGMAVCSHPPRFAAY